MPNESHPTATPETPEIIDDSKFTALPQYKRRFETDEDLKAFIDEKEMLRRLPVSRRTLFGWRESGKIPCVRLPGSRRVIFHWPSVQGALLRMQRGGE